MESLLVFLGDSYSRPAESWIGPALRTRTYKTLLGLGFDTDLIGKIGLNNHTVAALRSLSSKALASHYDQSGVQLIREKILRSAIPAENVDAVLQASDGVCCFHHDGVSSRPFQIHHPVEYSKTQDHSTDNLVLLCPNHHQTVPKTLTVEEQKRVRNEWYAIVRVARAYRLKGIPFPFGSFTALDYASQPDALALIEGFRVSNATALDMAQTSYAKSAVQRLQESPFLAIAGKSGSGKSTFARGVAGHFFLLGYQGFLFQPPKTNAVAEVLTFLSTADRNCILLLDDVNLYLTESDIATVQAAARPGALVVCTWTREALEAASLERHLPDWLLIDWEQLRPGVKDYLLRYETALAPAIGKRQGKGAVGRVGLGHMDERLETYLNRFESGARSVSEFLFLVRGGEEIVARELDILIEAERSDIPVLYAALEQIAGFERMVSVDEVVKQGNSLFEVSEIQPMTDVWVTRVFRSEVARGRMQEARGHFTTIHRDWGARLLDRALASERISGDADRLLSPVFDFSASGPERLVRMWSWFWYLPTAGKWERKILAQKSARDWTILVGRATAHSLLILCSLAGRMHLLFQHSGWTAAVGSAFESHEAKIRSLLTTATCTDWPSLKSLAWTIGHANPPLASRVWSGLNPSATAALIESTHPDYYQILSWFLASVKEHSPTWIMDVGRTLNVDSMLNQLRNVSQGDAESVFTAMEILRKLDVPIRRSTIRRIAGAFGKSLHNCPLRSFRIGFPPFWDPTWLVFNDDLEASLVGINEAALAQELSLASPREWRLFGDLTTFTVPAVAKLERKVVDHIDTAALAQSVALTAEGHEYELRCLLWSLSRGAQPVKTRIAQLLYSAVLKACHRSEQERFQLLKALYAVDAEYGERLQHELALHGPAIISDNERSQAKTAEHEQRQFRADVTRLKKQYADAERSGEDYVFEAWPAKHEIEHQ